MADTHRSDITCRLVIVVRIVQFICVTTCVVYSAIGHEYRDHAHATLPFWSFPVQTFFPAVMIYTALYASFTYTLRSMSYFAKAPLILDAVIIGLLIYSLSVLFDQETQNWRGPTCFRTTKIARKSDLHCCTLWSLTFTAIVMEFVLFSMSLFLQWFYRREYKRDMLYNPSPYQTRNPTITGRARVVVPTISEVMRIARNSHVRLWFPRTGRKQRKNKNFRRESYHRVSLPPTIADTGRVNVALTDIPHYES